MAGKHHVTQAEEICSAVFAGDDPEVLMIVAVKAFRSLPDLEIEEAVTAMVAGGAAEVAVKFLSAVQHRNIGLLSSAFKVMTVEKSIHAKVADHFDTLVGSGRAGEAMAFARKVDAEPFGAMEEAGCFEDGDNTLPDSGPFDSDQFDAGYPEPVPDEPEEVDSGVESSSNLEVEDIYRTLFKEIMADGIITDVEKKFVGDLRRILRISGTDYARIFNEVDKRYGTGEFRGRDEADPVGVYRKIVRKALADGVVTPEEEEIMFSVAQSLLIDRDIHLRLMEEERPSGKDSDGGIPAGRP